MPETYRNYVGGKWQACGSGATFPNTNPADTSEVVGLFQDSATVDAVAAAQAAAAAQPKWAALPAPRRGEFLFRAAQVLEAQLDRLAEDMTREEGKTLPEAKGEVTRAINIFRYFGGEGARQFSYQIPSERENVFAYTLRKPLGVVALITPWNFPSAIPAWKMAPALVAGNTVVIKPASLAPLSSYRLVEALHQVGIPEGVVNYVTGGGGAVGTPLIEHPAVKAISFTGSCGVGDQIYDAATRRRIRVQLEMGGKNPTIVMKDADLDYAADVVANGAFFSTGQKCTACSRAIVEKPVYDAFLKKLVERTRCLKVGNGMKPDVHIGPAVDGAQLETNLRYVEIGKEEGAELVFGGKRLTGEGYDSGFFMEPAIFTGVTTEMRLAQEEVFGPVLAVMAAQDFEDALRIANCARFGLAASIVTRDVTQVHRFINNIDAGLITVNLPTAGVEYQLPFGGTKESSFGMREQGPMALDFYTETRTVYLKYTQ